MNDVGKRFNGFGINTTASPADLSGNPRVSVTLKSAVAFELSLGAGTRKDDGKYHSSDILSRVVPGDGKFHTYYFDFKDYTHELWPGALPVDLAKIHYIFFYINLNTVPVTGTFEVDEVKIGEDVPFRASGSEENYIVGALSGWEGDESVFKFSQSDRMLIDIKKPESSNASFSKVFPHQAVIQNPVVQLVLRSSRVFSLAAQLVDVNGDTTRTQVYKYQPVAENTKVTFDFTRDLRMPSDTTPDANNIVEIRFVINPDGEAFSGTIEIFQLFTGNKARAEGYVFPLDLPVPHTSIYKPAFADVSVTSSGMMFTIGPDPSTLYRVINQWLPSWINMKEYPYVTVKVKSSQKVTLRIDIADSLGASTNGSFIIKTLSGTGFETITYDFTDRFSQIWPSAGVVDPSAISRILYFIEPGGDKFNGTIEFAEIRFGKSADEPARPRIVTEYKSIKVNQVGYFPRETKTAVVSSTDKSSFNLMNEKGEVVFEGLLSGGRYYTPSQEMVKIADFSSFKVPGEYRLCVPGVDTSYGFSIREDYLDKVSEDVIKAFYFQRSGTDLIAPYAEGWPRKGGHPDTHVLIHSSAATAERPEGTVISSPGGWYDAGDYNKYIVNSSVACYDLLAVYERFTEYFENRDLNIPETGNSLPDILDEVKYNLDWMLTMQDDDGGVYHKLSSLSWNSVYTKPAEDESGRYVVMKTTTASLGFAAVMAQAYRVYVRFPEYRTYALKCLHAAERSYNWAILNPAAEYDQDAMNSNYEPDVITGEYGENYSETGFEDEFFWAATELAIATQDSSFIRAIRFNNDLLKVMDWPKVYAYALMSLSHYGHLFSDISVKETAVSSIAKLGDYLESTFRNSAYRNSMRMDDFIWGSNTYAANEVMLLTEAYRQSGQKKYLDAAIGSIDYILGKNPAGYSYISGAGSHSPVNLYMAVGLSHDNKAQIPGFMAGGPNLQTTDTCKYAYNTLALNYKDAECSYSTNEVCINWNASVSFAANALNAMMTGFSPEAESFERGTLVSTFEPEIVSGITLYPNPAGNVVNINLHTERALLEISSIDGKIVKSGNLDGEVNSVSLDGILSGIYFVKITCGKGVWTEKLVVK
jgi:endoglucanase